MMNFVISLSRAVESNRRAKTAVEPDVSTASQGATAGQNGPGSFLPGNVPPVVSSTVMQIQSVPSTALVIVPPENIFTEEYMKDFIGNHYTGCDSIWIIFPERNST